MKIGSLVVEIGADSEKFDSAVDAAQAKISRLSGKARTAVSSFAMYSAAAGAAGVAIGAALVSRAANAIDAQAKLAQQLNTTSASLAAVERAGELSGIGMEKIASASRAVTTRLGQAAAGTGPAIDGLNRLGLSASELAALPLDQRINAINSRIRETIPASQQAAVAAQFFGEEAGTAILTLSGDTLAQARRETELFGLALTDVDAAKVEQANDAMSTFGMAADGIIQQMTVQLAPVLKAIADEFVSATDEAGGFSNIAIDAFAAVVDGAAFVTDAIDGIRRVALIVADGLIAGFEKIRQKIMEVAAAILEGASKIPGVDYSEAAASLRDYAEESKNIVDQAMSNIDETISQPMAGDELRQFVENAREAGQAAAEAAVEARDAVSGASTDGDAENPEQERMREQLNKRIEAIREANMTELELLMSKHAAENEEIARALEQNLLTENEWFEISKETKARQEEELTEIERRASDERRRAAEEEARAKQQIMSSAFSGLTTLMNSESRKMFEIGKAAAISNSIVSTYQGMTKALELGWPLGPIAASAIAATGFAQVQSIQSQSFGGGGGGSASTGTATQNVNAQSQPTGDNPASGPSQTMYVEGINPEDMFSGGMVKGLVSELIEYQRNGGQVILA